ncbi:phage tail terminator-like protein [uncultured Ruegeria sp.]|uniref:phage tail terminator-like protein n=1 Tax=uncultured Ruegeria sp. TaxID=259304 RepID=UPI00260192E8|nr:phage tail terminator-like protein [uncultured Ruegeria sp.]
MLEIEQAFISDFITQDFGLPIAHENVGYDPEPGTPYVKLEIFPNAERPADLNSTNNTTGLMQFTLYYAEGNGAIPAKVKRQEIFDAFPIGRVLTYSGRRVTITGRNPFRAYPDDGWYKVIGRVSYEADVPR